MKRTLFLLLGVFSSAYLSAQKIDSVSSPSVWLRGDLDQSTSNQWKDISFHHRHAQAVSSDQMPADTALLNFNKAFAFDGVNDYLKIPYSLDNLAELSVFTVFQSSDTTERGIWGLEQSTAREILLTTRRAIGPDTLVDQYGKYEHVLALNSLLQSWDNSAPPVISSAFLALGSAGAQRPYNPWKGSLAEMLIYNRALTFLERIQIETYLAIKYGTGLRSNYVDSNEKVLWSQQQNEGFNHHIIGIGRDDHFALYQKQTTSAYDSGLLIVSAGTLAAENTSNTSSIADGNFILIGSNALPMSLRKGDGADSVLTFIQRKWQAVATGLSSSAIATSMYFHAEQFPGDPMGYWLVIDRSGTANFSVDNLEYLVPSQLKEGKVVYRDIRWDPDGSGKDHFGFAKIVSPFALVKTLSDPSCLDERAGRVSLRIISGSAPFDITLADEKGVSIDTWKLSDDSLAVDDLTKGMYSFTIKDAAKEQVIRRIELLMPDGLTIDLGEDKTLSDNQPVMLDVTSQVPDSIEASYLWENSFGFSSTDEKVSATESGVYRVFVTKASDGCVFTDEVVISGAEETRYAVYPNVLQSNEPFNISISLPESSAVEVGIFNSSGLRTTSMADKGKSEYQFMTRMKDPGLYMIVIQTASGIETRKVIIH